MLERFTQRARETLVFAREEARGRDRGRIGPEHILLGLLREDGGPAAEALRHLGVGLDAARNRTAALTGMGDRRTAGEIGCAEHGALVVEGSLREALALGHNAVTSGHLLLSLVRDEQADSIAVQVLADLGAPRGRVRTETIARIPAEPENEIIRMIKAFAGRADRRARRLSRRGVT